MNYAKTNFTENETFEVAGVPLSRHEPFEYRRVTICIKISLKIQSYEREKPHNMETTTNIGLEMISITG